MGESKVNGCPVVHSRSEEVHNNMDDIKTTQEPVNFNDSITSKSSNGTANNACPMDSSNHSSVDSIKSFIHGSSSNKMQAFSGTGVDFTLGTQAVQTRLTEFKEEAVAELMKLAEKYGPEGSTLSKIDVVTLMDGWNKVLAFQTLWKEACFMRWRILLAREKVRVVLYLIKLYVFVIRSCVIHNSK